MITSLKWCLYFFLLTKAFDLSAQSFPSKVLIRIDTMHTAPITKMVIDRSDKYILTSSYDRSAKLWNAVTGKYIRTFYCPLDDSAEGEINACALSNDGNLAAIGGNTHSQTSADYCAYLFNTENGEIVRKLEGIREKILDIAFSPDGRYMALSIDMDDGVYIYSTKDFKLVKIIDHIGGACFKVDFDINGRLALGTDGNEINLYSTAFKKIASGIKKEDLPSYYQFLADATFNSTGERLAVCYSSVPRIKILKASDFSLLFEPSYGGIIGGEQFNTVIFSTDDKYIYAGGMHINMAGEKLIAYHYISRWENKKGTNHIDIDSVKGEISALKPCNNGDFIVATQYPELARFSKDGKLKYSVTLNRNDFVDLFSKQGPDFRVNEDGSRISFKTAKNSFTFDILAEKCTNGVIDAPAFKEKQGDLQITNWRYNSKPQINNRVPEYFKFGEVCYNVDISSDAQNVIVSTHYNLRCINKEGTSVWTVPLKYHTIGLKISGNNQVVVLIMEDGTIRWYRMKDGKVLLTLNTSSDVNKWILYTPKGFYECPAGAERLLGFVYNNNGSRPVEFKSMAELNGEFRRPDVIKETIRTYSDR